MAGLLKCLLHMPEDLSLMLRAILEMAHACHPRDGKVRARGKWAPWTLEEQTAWPPW